ncbi:unnamed protein product [Parajaminaea phylloscopi]
MRILTWNVNGWKKIRTYQPFFSLPSWSAIVSYLEADIVCLQETKLTRKQAALDREMCVPGEGWESFWDFHPSKGYSGTATYVQTSTTPLPVRCETGLTGRKVHDAAQRIGGYPTDLRDELDIPLYESLDEEGRCVVLDFGFFVLFNLYCPVMGSEERHDFRMAFYAALDERARKLVSAGRNVIIVGDINIARQPIDHCDWCDAAAKNEDLSTYYVSPARAWFHRFIEPQGPFSDVQRDAFPDRKGMYTCWSTLINARPANYGTRIDYTLVSPGLKDWVKRADIQNQTPGSDHCPVFVDLHDERLIDGKVVRLRDLMTSSSGATASALAASRWEEFNRKDLKSFFAKARAAEAAGASKMQAFAEAGADVRPDGAALANTPKTDGEAANVSHKASVGVGDGQMSSRTPAEDVPATTSAAATTSARPKQSPARSASAAVGKRPRSSTKSPSAGDRDEHRKGKQLKLGSFFASSSPGKAANGSGDRRLSTTPLESPSTVNDASIALSLATELRNDIPDDVSEQDWTSWLSASETDASASQTESTKPGKGASTAWSSLFTAPPPPRCPSHGEDAKSYTVNKRGANVNRKFWLCSRVVGPGYEKGFGSSEARREGGEYRCGFFKWNSDWEKEWKKQRQQGCPAASKSRV